MPKTKSKAERFPFAVLAGMALSVSALFYGCLPANGTCETVEAPVVNTDVMDAETAYWRNEYRKNRIEPPRDFQVRAKPAPNNQFGEFEDEMYYGLDRQQTLPQLPNDPHIMPMVGGPASYSMPAGTYVDMTASEQRGVRTTAPGAAPISVGVRPAGVAAEGHFYPVEQLVYGGDYPDLDKPELYRLMPKDVISVTVKDHPEFSGKLEIQPDGTIRIANTPDFIRIRGMTVDESAEEIRRNLSVYVRGECVVRVQANRARGGYYFVFGDVLQPGRFPMGLEPVKLSDAVLAANWEANPSRLEADGDELGPAFPAASPRGRFIAPRSADLARVMLITPHRSQPARTVHDVRGAMLGMTANDPAIRPGQIVVVPSLDPARNGALGLDMPPAAVPATMSPPPASYYGQGFSTASSPARLPDVTPPAAPQPREATAHYSAVDSNMAMAFDVQANTGPFETEKETITEACETGDGACETTVSRQSASPATSGTGRPVGRKLGKKLPEKQYFSTREEANWNKGL